MILSRFFLLSFLSFFCLLSSCKDDFFNSFDVASPIYKYIGGTTGEIRFESDHVNSRGQIRISLSKFVDADRIISSGSSTVYRSLIPGNYSFTVKALKVRSTYVSSPSIGISIGGGTGADYNYPTRYYNYGVTRSHSGTIEVRKGEQAVIKIRL